MLDADNASWLVGLVWALFCGLAIGNYATNPIYRLPRNEPLFGRKPYCGDCNAELKAKDLFPILSWFSTMGKCRYCGAGVPVAYVVAEILITAMFVILYCQVGFDDSFILIGLGGTALLMLVMMEIIDRFFSDKALLFFITMGAMLRILSEGEIGGATQGAFFMALPALAVWWWRMRHQSGMGPMPDYVKLMVAAGVWLALEPVALFLAVWAVLETAVRLASKIYPGLRGKFPLTATYAAALLIPVLFPKSVGLFFSLF